MEGCDILVDTGVVSRGQQTEEPLWDNMDTSPETDNNSLLNENIHDDTDGLSQHYLSEKLLDSLINPALKDNSQSVEETESMAVSLMIAFKADKHTLDRRLEIQTRLRDQSETNVANEITNLSSILSQLMPMCEEGEKGALLKKLEEQVEMLHRSARYVSSVAEMFGAVQQERRLFNAMEVITRHVENLKQNLVNEKLLHEQTRKLLTENKLVNTTIKIDTKRRASLATLDQTPSPADSRHSSRKGSLIKRFGNCKSSSFSEISLDLRKGDSENSVLSMEERGEGDGGYIIEPPTPDCSDACRCSTTNPQAAGEIENEIEIYQRKRSSLQDDTSSQRKHHPMRYKFQKRSSFMAPRWFVRLAEAWGWNRLGDIANKIRYSAACACVIAAIAILSSSFFISDKQSP